VLYWFGNLDISDGLNMKKFLIILITGILSPQKPGLDNSVTIKDYYFTHMPGPGIKK